MLMISPIRHAGKASVNACQWTIKSMTSPSTLQTMTSAHNAQPSSYSSCPHGRLLWHTMGRSWEIDIYSLVTAQTQSVCKQPGATTLSGKQPGLQKEDRGEFWFNLILHNVGNSRIVYCLCRFKRKNKCQIGTRLGSVEVRSLVKYDAYLFWQRQWLHFFQIQTSLEI